MSDNKRPRPKGELLTQAHRAAGYRALQARAVMSETPEVSSALLYARCFNKAMQACEALDRIVDEHHCSYKEGKPIGGLHE